MSTTSLQVHSSFGKGEYTTPRPDSGAEISPGTNQREKYQSQSRTPQMRHGRGYTSSHTDSIPGRQLSATVDAILSVESEHFTQRYTPSKPGKTLAGFPRRLLRLAV